MADEKRPGKIVIISGFSGVGKGTVVKKLLQDFGHYVLSVSMTTRKPREGEKDGVNYYFVTNEKFENMIGEDGFLEHAGYADHYYGTPKDFVIQSTREGKNVILEIEVQGAMQIKKKISRRGPDLCHHAQREGDGKAAHREKHGDARADPEALQESHRRGGAYEGL